MHALPPLCMRGAFSQGSEPARARGPQRHVLRELSDGARFVLSHPLLRPIVITAIFFNVSWFVLQAAYVVYAVQELGLSPATVG